jgi:hypothetical protein
LAPIVVMMVAMVDGMTGSDDELVGRASPLT